MTQVLQNLIELLSLETIEENLFRGQSQDLGWGTVFGGQVLGQALSAAAQTVPEARTVHSFHGYFLRPGAVDRPIVYEVDRIRDGKSFTTRRVVAIQKGRAIFNLSSSFQKSEPGFEHQDDMPDVPGPEELLNEQQIAQKAADAGLIPEPLLERALAPRPIEARPVKTFNPLNPREMAPRQQVWLKATDGLPDRPTLHAYLLAYASDFKLLSTSMMPHGVSWLTPGMQVASIDHAMYFHRPFRIDDWLLYDMRSSSASNARGLTHGQIFNRDGALVASCVQEGLIRKRS